MCCGALKVAHFNGRDFVRTRWQVADVHDG
jgi:hypothetical protein